MRKDSYGPVGGPAKAGFGEEEEAEDEPEAGHGRDCYQLLTF